MIRRCCPRALLVLVLHPCAAQPPDPAPAKPGTQGNAMTIDEIYSNCGAPGDCGVPLACEGKQYRVRGLVSRVNLWDKRLHPWLPESKFLLNNAAQTLSLEVRVAPAAAARLFDRLAAQPKDWDGSVILTGTLAGIDLPIMSGCHRAPVALLSEPGALVVGTGGDRTSESD